MPPPRFLGIQVAAALIFACTVMNVSFFFGFMEEIWAMKRPSSLHRGLMIEPSVCVVIPFMSPEWNSTVSGLVTSVSGDRDYAFSVFFVGGDSANESQWNAPSSSNVQFHSHANDTSVFDSFAQSCTYFLIIDSATRFVSPGWAASLEHALQRFSPQYLGVVTPVECRNCAFVHSSMHADIFSGFSISSAVSSSCWAEWVRLSYGQCRSVFVSNSGIISTGMDTCLEEAEDGPSSSSLFSALVTRGRLYIRKFLTLGIEEFRASRKAGTRGGGTSSSS
jgi:hypothetical protein